MSILDLGGAILQLSNSINGQLSSWCELLCDTKIQKIYVANNWAIISRALYLEIYLSYLAAHKNCNVSV